jgi:hypothetical protein
MSSSEKSKSASTYKPLDQSIHMDPTQTTITDDEGDYNDDALSEVLDEVSCRDF